MRNYDLERFVRAQDADRSFDQAMRELDAGQKRSHWMWWVFPQTIGLGSSGTSRKYAIGSLEEAIAYAAHPILGLRLREATRRVLAIEGHSALEILGSAIDEKNLRSSMMLFLRACPSDPLFALVLDKYYNGQSSAC